jgi:hypothetical protein
MNDAYTEQVIKYLQCNKLEVHGDKFSCNLQGPRHAQSRCTNCAFTNDGCPIIDSAGRGLFKKLKIQVPEYFV